MALPSSGPISMSQVNVELGLSSTALISLNDAAVRSLFQKASGVISLSDGYGKKAPFTTGTAAFSYTGSSQTWTVPSGISKVRLKAWGAGGRTGFVNNPGAIGGFSQAEFNVTPGEVINIVVGGAGTVIGGGAGAFGGGGQGTAGGGGGGGMTRFHRTGIELVAGGGGGTGDANTGYGASQAGVGGGANLSGGSATDTASPHSAQGGGGTTSAGGAAGLADLGYVVGATAGSSFQGGRGDTYTNSSAGGGSGYYGGGGGGGPGGSGGGGSGFSNGTNTIGYNNNNTGDPNYPGSVGGANQNGYGFIIF